MELEKQEKARKEAAKRETDKPLSEDEIAAEKEDEARTQAKIAEFRENAKPKPKQMFLSKECSIRDLLESVQRMADYDRMMTDLEIIGEVEFKGEDAALKRQGRPYVRELVPLPEVEEHVQYS